MFVNSYRNGASSWIPKYLPENIKIILSLTNTQLYTKRDTLHEETSKFLESQTNLHLLKEYTREEAEMILKSQMENIGRKLTNHQWRVVFNALQECRLPLFTALCFDKINKWQSYTSAENTQIPFTIESCISDLFDALETKYGSCLVRQAIGYITASKNGLSESELEDILCLDETVLDEVFKYHIPTSMYISTCSASTGQQVMRVVVVVLFLVLWATKLQKRA